MKINHARSTSAALVVIAGGLLAQNAFAQSFYTNPFASGHTYANVSAGGTSIYINDRGDLGAPYRSTGIAKPNGFTDANGNPYINPDKSVNTAVTINGAQNGTYGLVVNKAEYLTSGPTNVAEGFAIIGNSTRLQNGPSWLNASNFTVQSFQAAPGSVPGVVSNLFRQTGTASTQGLLVTQTVTLDAASNRISFNVSFTNNDIQTLSGLQYARAINPNQGGSLPAATGNTQQGFGLPNSSSSFGINTSVGQRQLGLAIKPGDPNTLNARITATTTTQENSLLSNPDVFFGSNRQYVQLGAGNNATFNVGDGTTKTTSNFTTDKGFAPTFGAASSGDDALVLESGTFSLAPGATDSFNFFLLADPITAAAVPEPGAMPLLAGILLSSGMLALRRRRA